MRQEFADTCRRAGAKANGIAQQQPAHVCRVKPVHVFVGRHRGIDRRLPNVGRERSLHENAMQTIAPVEVIDQSQQVPLRRGLGQHARFGVKTQIRTCVLLATHVNP